MATAEKAATPAAEKARPVPMARERARHPLVGLRDEIDRLFEDFWSGSALRPFGGRLEREPLAGRLGLWGDSAPVADMVETDKDYRIKAELPGLEERDIEVTVRDDVLTLKGEKKEEHEDKEEGYYLAERRYGSFERAFRLPADVDGERIEASFRNGVLTLTLPKSPEARQHARKIAIKAG